MKDFKSFILEDTSIEALQRYCISMIKSCGSVKDLKTISDTIMDIRSAPEVISAFLNKHDISSPAQEKAIKQAFKDNNAYRDFLKMINQDSDNNENLGSLENIVNAKSGNIFSIVNTIPYFSNKNIAKDICDIKIGERGTGKCELLLKLACRDICKKPSGLKGGDVFYRALSGEIKALEIKGASGRIRGNDSLDFKGSITAVENYLLSTVLNSDKDLNKLRIALKTPQTYGYFSSKTRIVGLYDYLLAEYNSRPANDYSNIGKTSEEAALNTVLRCLCHALSTQFAAAKNNMSPEAIYDYIDRHKNIKSDLETAIKTNKRLGKNEYCPISRFIGMYNLYAYYNKEEFDDIMITDDNSNYYIINGPATCGNMFNTDSFWYDTNIRFGNYPSGGKGGPQAEVVAIYLT